MTLITRSSLSEESEKYSKVVSGLTNSASKNSLPSSKRLSIKNVVSEVIIPTDP
mgnify:CR=1 FL=1